MIKRKKNFYPGWIWSAACICSSVILSNSFCVWSTSRVRLTVWRKPGWVHFFTKILLSHIWISGNMLTLGPGFRLSVRLWRRITIIFRGNSWKIREKWVFWGRHWKRRRTTSTSWWRKPGKYLLYAQNMLKPSSEHCGYLHSNRLLSLSSDSSDASFQRPTFNL